MAVAFSLRRSGVSMVSGVAQQAAVVGRAVLYMFSLDQQTAAFSFSFQVQVVISHRILHVSTYS